MVLSFQNFMDYTNWCKTPIYNFF